MNSDRSSTDNAEVNGVPQLTHRNLSNPELLPRALALLAELLTQGEALDVFITRHGLRAVLTVQPVALAPSVPTVNPAQELWPALANPVAPSVAPPRLRPRGKEFTPVQAEIMKVMEGTTGWLTKVAITEQIGHNTSSWLSYELTNLVERDYLESSNKGYRLAVAEGQP